MEAIRFYGIHGPHPYLSNFHNVIFEVDGRPVASAEHAYQAYKATTVEDRDWILGSPTAAVAKLRGQKVKVRPEWEHVVGTPALHERFQDSDGFILVTAKDFFMFQVIVAKFQVPELKRRLLSTGDTPLIEASPKDYYWGEGRNQTGQNKLGRILQLVRTTERTRIDDPSMVDR